MRYILVLLTILGATGLSYFAPIYAVCLFLWQNIFQPLRFAFHHGSLPLASYVLVVLLGSFAFNWYKGTFKPRVNFFTWAVPVFLGWVLVCAAVSEYEPALENFVKVLKYLLPLVLISTIVQTRKDVELVIAVLMFSVGLWAAAGGILGPLHGAYPFLNIEGSQMTDNNEVAAATVGYIPFVVYFIFNYRWKFRLLVRLGLVGFLLVSISSIVFSQSRGAAVALGALVCFHVVFLSRSKIRDFIVIGAIAGIGFTFLPQSFLDRMGTIELGVEQTEGSAQNRMALMKAAFEGTLDNPVFGMGPYCWLQGSNKYIDDPHNPHDVWVKCSVEIGVPGLALYLWIILTTLGKLYGTSRKALKAGDKPEGQICLALMASIISICLGLTFLSQPYWEYQWAIMGTGCGFATWYSSRPKKAAMGSGVGRAKRPA